MAAGGAEGAGDDVQFLLSLSLDCCCRLALAFPLLSFRAVHRPLSFSSMCLSTLSRARLSRSMASNSCVLAAWSCSVCLSSCLA